MLLRAMNRPTRVLMTLDAVGGIWRYAVDLAAGLNRSGIACLLVGCGPRAGAALPPGLAATELVWTDAPLDWMVEDEAALEGVGDTILDLARAWRADLLHLNLPSQAAGMARACPVLTVAHSCVPTWWDAVRREPLPQHWAWQHGRNRRGLERADCVLAPSAGHAACLGRVYGPLGHLRVVPNATALASGDGVAKQPFVLAAARWWDEGKGAATLDRAARDTAWPVRMAGQATGPTGQHVTFEHARGLGVLAPGELLGLMRSAAIFAAPSLYEPFGLAVLEAAIHHAALVLSDIPTFRELWEGAAMFAEPGNPDAFARAIAALTEDAPLRERLAGNAAAIAREFTVAGQVDGVLDGYAAAMIRHGAR